MKKNYTWLFCIIFLFTFPMGARENSIVVTPENFQSIFELSNSIYEIYDDFDLQGKELFLPPDSTLKFIAGKISNGTIIFSNTQLEGNICFYNCNIRGKIKNNEIFMSWFIQPEKKINQDFFNESLIIPIQPIKPDVLQNLIFCAEHKTLIVDQLYYCSQPVIISSKITIMGYFLNEGVYANLYGNAKAGFCFPDWITGLKVIEGGILSLRGLSIIGSSQLYIAGNLWETVNPWNGQQLQSPVRTCGVCVEKGGEISAVYDSTFNGFTFGLKLEPGAKLNFVNNTYFSCCRYGFYADSVSSFKLTGCRFNTNLVNFPFDNSSVFNSNMPIKINEGDILRYTGSGVYLKNCKNASIEKSRFEFNNIHLIIDECGKDLKIINSIFDTACACQVLIFNASDSKNTVTDGFDSKRPAMNNIVFSGNTMARGARRDYLNNGRPVSKPGFAIFHITEGNNRGSKIIISNNIICDDMEIDKNRDVYYEPYIFAISNTSNKGSNYIITGNSFAASKAKTVFYVLKDSSGQFNLMNKGNSIGTLVEKAGQISVLVELE